MAEPKQTSEQANPVAPAVPKALTPAPPSLADQYDLDETSGVEPQDATVGGAAPPEAGSTPPEEPARPVPPKDPVTGRFIKAAEAQEAKHLGTVVRRARQLGLTDEDIAEQTPEGLSELVYHLQEQRKYFRQDQERQERETDSGSPAQVLEINTAPGTPAPEPESKEVGLDPAIYDAGLVAAFDWMKRELKAVKADNDQLKKHVAAMTGREIQRDNNRASVLIDRLFQGMKRPDIYGDQDRADLAAGSAELTRRLAVINATGCQSALDPTFPRKLKEAHEKMFGAQPARPAAAEPAAPADEELLRRWDASALSRPTQRVPPPEPKGEKRATRAVAEQMREMNLGQYDQADDAVKDGFLD